MSVDESNGPKRKRDHFGGGPSNKRAIMSAMRSMTSVNLPPGLLEASPTANGYPRKNNKSNNRREWMKECLKLLENMMTLDDSKPFREPVDCLKYPDFYTEVSDPIDLSKVMLKFRGGQYSDPFEFQKDVKQLFQDYKMFFKDPKSEIFMRTFNCNLWFDIEFKKILEKYGDKLKKRADWSTLGISSESSLGSTSPAQNTNIMVSINNGSCTIVQSPERQVQAPISDPILTGANWAQLRAIPGKPYSPLVQQQQQIISQQPSAGQRPTSPYYHSNSHQQQQQTPPAGLVAAAANHLKEYYGASYPSENTPPDRWVHGDLSPKPMITHSPKKLDPKNSEVGVTRILNKRDALHTSGGGSSSFDIDISRSRSPDYQFDHVNRHHLSERSYSHHSDPGFLRKDLSRDLGSPPHHLLTPTSHHQHYLGASGGSLGVGGGGGAGVGGLGLMTGGLSQYSDDNTSGIGTPPCSLSGSQGAPCSSPPNKEGVINKAAIHANAHVGTALVGMKLDVGSIWFGTVSVKPVEPVIVHENGLRIHLVHKDKGHNIVLKLKVEEIVRCVAHLGRNRKHTLFIFVTPSFTQTVELALSERDTRASLLVFFMPALTVSQIGRLLHVFHSMNKHSMLGNLFSEIDQKAALSLLASIKPNAVDKVGDRIKGGLNGSLNKSNGGGGSEHSHSNKKMMLKTSLLLARNNSSLERNPMARSSSLPVTSSPPPSKVIPPFGKRACSMDQGALDLTVVPTFGITPPPSSSERSSPARDTSPAPPVTQSTAYKPKFHFRSHSTHAAMMSKQNSANSESGGSTAAPYKGSQSLDLDMMSRGGEGGQTYGQVSPVHPKRGILARQSNLEVGEKHQNGWLTGGESGDSELEYEPDDEGLGSSQHSVLLINDSSGEDMTMVDPEYDEDRLSHTLGMDPQEDDLVMTEQKVSLRCPITQQYMKYPLRNRHCAHCYDREGVAQLIKDRGSKARCPVAGCGSEHPLKMIDLTFDGELCRLVKKQMNGGVK